MFNNRGAQAMVFLFGIILNLWRYYGISFYFYGNNRKE